MDKLDICPGESDATNETTGDTNNPNESSTSVHNTEYYETSELFSPELFNDSNTNSTQNSSPSSVIFCELAEIKRADKSSRSDSFLTPIQTSKIFKEDSPSQAAVVPTVPTSLVPFISTVNESWTSDLETPNAETAASNRALENLHNGESSERRKSHDSLRRNRCESLRSNAVLPEATTPNGCFVPQVDDEGFSISPILQTGNKRHKPKRRILKLLDKNTSTSCLTDITNVVEPAIEKYELSKLDENIESEIGNESCICDLANDNSLAEKDRIIQVACGKSCLSKKIDKRNIEDPIFPNNAPDQSSIRNPVKDEEKTVPTHVSTRCDDKIDERLNEIDKKSFGDRLKEIKKLRKNKPQFGEDNYVSIPNEFFTKEAEALESAEMSLIVADVKKCEKSHTKSRPGLISFTQMCLSEENSKKIEPSGGTVNDSSNDNGTRVVGVGETDPGIGRIVMPENVPKHESMRNESSAMSLEEDEADIAAIFACSFADKDETVIDVDEFSPWFYNSDETKSDSSKFAKIPGNSSSEPNLRKARGELGTTTIEMSSFGSIGFSTACGKPIEVSEDKMRQARKLYDEISAQDGNDREFESSNKIVAPENCRDDKNGNKNTGGAAIPENIYDMTGFSTAGGKPIKISEEKLKQAEKLYAEVSAEVKGNFAEKSLSFSHSSGAPAARGIKRKQESDRTCELNSVVGFTTASGQPLKVSGTAMKRAKLMFHDEYNLNDDVEPPKELPKSRNEQKVTLLSAEPESANQKPGNVFSGFTTAGGKSLAISKSALARAERMYKDLSDVPDAEGGAAATDLANSDHESIANVDDDAFNIGKRNSVGKKVPESSAGLISTGFSTANGIAIRVSDAAISRAEKLLAEEGIDRDSKSLSNTTRGEDKFVGFSSASEKRSKWSAVAQENTPPSNSSTKRSFLQPIETSTTNCKNKNVSVFARPEFGSPFKNVNLRTEVSGSAFKKSKKIRPSSDLQRRKLFSEKGSCGSDEEAEDAKKSDISAYEGRKSVTFCRNNAPEIYANPEMFRATDRSGISRLEPQKSSPSIFLNKQCDLRSSEARNEELASFSEEITASTEALLADEENSNDGKSWAITCSPTITEDRRISMRPIILGEDGDTILEAPKSPIMGAKFRSRKTKRRKRKSVLIKNAPAIKAANNDRTDEKEVITEQTKAPCSQSFSTTTSTSNSFKELHRTDSPVGGVASVQKFNEFLESTENAAPAEKIFNEIDHREAIAEVLENRMAAMLEQEKIIRAKKKLKPKPVPGSLLLCKMSRKESRISLRDLTNGIPPAARTPQELTDLGIGSEVVKITAANAVRHRLKCADFRSFNGEKKKIFPDAYRLDVGDGGRLILDENGFAGAEEFERAFVASPNVDPSLLAQGWVENHYRWIVWKLASMDRMKLGKNRMLTADHIMKQLKYRYDREIDRSQRPALRRIIEKDDPACRRIILCVADLTKISNEQSPESKSPKIGTTSRWKVELTDGWYSIAASVDAAMEHLISSGKVREGTKLVICGAELLNCDQGCSPLEIPVDVSLKIHCNSTRRVRWDAKLGYCKNAAPIPTRLSAVLPYGGLIGKLDTIIARLYPIQYFEKTPSGQAIFRNDKCEDKAATIHEEKRQAQIDAVYSKARADFESKNWKDSKTNSTVSSIESFRNEVDSILQKSLPPPRKVTPVLKARVIEGAIIASLTVWAPSEDIIDVMKEGNRVSVHNLQSSGRRSGELCLTVGRQSFVKYEGSADDFPRRRLTEIKEIAAAGFSPIFGDFDTVGVVVSFGPAPHGMKNFEVVNLAFPNPDSSGSAYLSILFWDGIAAYGFSDILTVGSIVACVNLQWRRGLPKIIPIAYSTEHSTFTRNPRQVYLRSAFEHIKDQITDLPSYTAQCALQIANENEKKTIAVRSPAIHESPISVNERSTTAIGANQRTPQGATINTGDMITPAKYSIQRRLEKLQCYGEPPLLSPIIINQNSIKVKQKFISPLRTPEKRN